MMDTMERRTLLGERLSRPTEYEYSHPLGPVMPVAYRLSDEGNERRLLIRWWLDGQYVIDDFTYTLEQMDSGGRVLAVTEQRCLVTASATEDFIPTYGTVVHSRCTDLRVTVTEIRSGGYVYRLQGDGYKVDFEEETPWVYDRKSEGVTPKKCLRVRSKGRIHGKFLWLAPVAAVCALGNLLFFAIVGPEILSGVFRWIREFTDIIARYGW